MANLLSTTVSGSLSVNVDSSGSSISTVNNGNASRWYGRITTFNSTSDKSVFLGTYASVAVVGAHNNALTAWANLYVNNVDGVNGGNVYLPTNSYVANNSIVHTGGGQTIAGITYFSNGESLQVYGIRGRFTNEYIHLYHKVGIGNPNGWGVGEGSTPGYGLSTYGGIVVAYGNAATSQFQGHLRIDRNWGAGDYGAEQFTIRGTYPSIALRSTNSNSKWLIHNADRLQFYYGGTVDDNNWGNKFEIPTDGNIWMAWANDYISNLLGAKQNASTAITTSNIGSQSVSYASSAGNADTVDGFHASVAGNANTIPTRNANGYLIPENWIQLNGIYGLYSPTNGAHLRPNPNSYGSWLMTGSRNGWQGIEFDSGSNGNVTMMVSTDSRVSGFHNNSYGWQIKWDNGTLYVGKGINGGSNATVWDSSNAPRANFDNLMYYQGFTLDANTMATNSTGFTYAVNAPFYGPIARFSTGGSYDLWIGGSYGGGGNAFYLRTRNGDNGTFNAWREIITSGNIASQSVSYADESGYSASSGSVEWTSVQNKPSLMPLSGIPSGSDQYVNLRVIRNSNAGSGSGMHIGYGNQNSGDTLLYGGGGTSAQLYVYGDHVYSPSSFRAPIFYDSADTSYYLDPNGSSVLNGTVVIKGNDNQLAIDGTTGALASGLFFRESGVNKYELYHYSGEFRFYNYTTGQQEMSINNAGGFVTARTSFRAPIFYDSQDTGYYVDPNSVSVLADARSYRFKNINSVTADDNFGLYFGASDGTPYAIYRESGSWTHPYPDLRIAFHTGIKIGANSSYEGIRFYTDYDMATQVMSVNNGSDPLGGGNVYVNNSLQAGSSLRAPIFYDSNDTGYYGNFAGFSRLSEAGITNTYTYNYFNVESSRAVAEFGHVGLFRSRQSATTDYIPFSFQSQYGDHSWGQVARFHIEQSGADRPSIQFSSGTNNTRWNVGYCYSDDNFRITQNMGYRPDLSGNFDGWGTERFRINTDGTAYLPSTLYTNEISHANGRVLLSGNMHIDTYNGNDIFMNYYSARGTRIYVGSGTLALHVNTDGLVYMPTVVVNSHSDNTKGYRIHNTSGTAVSAMFVNSSNALVLAAGAVDQINLNKKVYVNGVALGVNVAPSATAGRIDASNDIVAYSSSDERLKYNIAPIENALDKVKSLTGVEFDWKPEYKHAHGYEGHDTGIIAQQVEAVMPSAVRTNDTGFLAVRYEKLIGLLIEGMKEQQAQIDELKAKLDGLTK